MSKQERYFRAVSVAEHEFVSYSSYVDSFQKTPEVFESLDFLRNEYDWGPVIVELYDYFVSRFGQVIERNNVRLECCGDEKLTAKQYQEFPKIINDRIESENFRLYKVKHHDQIVMSRIIPDGSYVFLPNRKEKLEEILKGREIDEDLLCMSEDLLNVGVRGEGFKSVLTRKEIEVLFGILSGENVSVGINTLNNLRKKIVDRGWGDDFKIVLDGEEYKLERISTED